MIFDLFNELPLGNPGWLWFIPIIFLLLLLLIPKDFVKLSLDNYSLRKRKKKKTWIFISRFLIFTFLIIALSAPYTNITEETAGNPHLTILVDNSNSMKYLDTSFLTNLETALKSRIPVTVRELASGNDSSIGEGILDNIEQDSNILLISDGNVISGSSMKDVAFFAANQLNATISAINMKESITDFSVFIEGPESVVSGSSNTFLIKITGTNNDPVKLTVMVDGQKIFDKKTSERVIELTKEFPIGNHEIEAFISNDDGDQNNNVFYKTVSVLQKPKILLLSEKNGGLESILNELYSVDKKSSLPADLSPYYAIVANDVDASKLNNINLLNDFLIDEKGGYYGGGLVVVGGFNSFDRGNYHNSPIESLLPVTVGKGSPKKGKDNIIIILDVSGGSTGVRYEKKCDNGNCQFVEVKDKVSSLDIIKAQAVNLISSEQNILASNKVGVIAFGIQGTITDRATQGHYDSSKTIGVVEPLDYLYNNQGRLQEKIPRLIGGGPSEIGLALRQAYDMFKGVSGQKYILLLTDGNVGPRVQKEAEGMVDTLQNRGIKTFIYGVGRDEKNIKSDFLTNLAKEGDGLYEGPVYTTKNVHPSRISIKWGDPKQKSFGDDFGLIIFSLTHFITKDLELNANLNGFNQVVPKSAANMIVTTDFGQPALTTWKYGNGRVAVLTVFTGSGLGELLNADNSEFITRTVNWAIGDPKRKEDFFVSVNDARINNPTTIRIKSKDVLSSKDVDFSKEGDFYTTTIVPDKIGFNQFFGATFAVNYNKEEQYIGMNPSLNDTLQIANGKLFSPEDIDSIVQYVSEVSKKKVVHNKLFIWPFITLALLVLLVEIFMRRLNKRSNY